MCQQRMLRISSTLGGSDRAKRAAPRCAAVPDDHADGQREREPERGKCDGRHEAVDDQVAIGPDRREVEAVRHGLADLIPGARLLLFPPRLRGRVADERVA